MGLIVLDAGLCSTVQDLGRPGHRSRGVPVSGAFDLDAHDLANALVGNPRGSATLELTLIGGAFEATVPMAIALTGAPMAATIDRAEGGALKLVIPQSATLEAGDRLRLGRAARGVRSYLAVRGGWLTPIVLGSRSSETRLRAGDRLPAAPSRSPSRWPSPSLGSPEPEGPIRILDGPDAGRLAHPGAWDGLDFRVDPQSDRMGLRLVGPSPEVQADPDRDSTPVAPGAVQVAGGRLILLGPACGTMGGYPHVAHVITADLPRLAQARPGDPIRLRLISLTEARRLDLDAWRRSAARRLLLRSSSLGDPPPAL